MYRIESFSGSVLLKEGHLMSMILLRHYSTVSLFQPWRYLRMNMSRQKVKPPNNNTAFRAVIWLISAKQKLTVSFIKRPHGLICSELILLAPWGHVCSNEQVYFDFCWYHKYHVKDSDLSQYRFINSFFFGPNQPNG